MKTSLSVLTGVLALTFVLTGAGKVLALAPSPENFARWGLSPMFMYVIGALEILGGLGLLVRRVAVLSAFGLVLLMIGAIRTGIVHHELMHVILPSTLIVLLSLAIYLRRRIDAQSP